MEPGDFTQLSPVNTPASAVLVGDYAAYWLDTLPSRLKPRTVKSYRELYRLHLAPSFNGIGLGELKRAQVKALLLDKHRQGLSRNTVRLIGSCLSAFCSEAIDNGLLTVSPVAALGRWLRGSAGEQCDAIGRARTIRPFTSREVASILAAARKFYPRYYPLFLTLARTGCRPGEALVLRWSDVNFARREILIERALSAGRIGPTKTGRSRRVDVSWELLAVLNRLCKQGEAHARRHRLKALSDWVF
jgi:integrase